MRLALDAQTGVGGRDTGVGRVTQALRRSLPAAGAEVVELRRRSDAPIGGAPERAWWEWVTLPRLASAAGAEALLSPGFSARAPRGMPLAVVVHDVLPLERPAELGRLNGWYWRGLVPACWRRADLRICVSEATREALGRALPGVGRTVAIPNGVDRALAPAGPAEGGEYLLLVGAWPARKDPLTAARAVAALPEAPQLRVVGRIPGALEAEIGAVLGSRARFEGYVRQERMAALYRGAAAVVCPSAAEGFGLVPLEAAACGAPVLMSDIPPHQEALPGVEPFGPPGDHAALAAALEACLEDRSRWLPPPGWQPRSWSAAAAEYVAAMESLA